MGNSAAKLQDTIFNLAYTSKTFNRHYQKSLAAQKKHKLKVKKAVEEGNLEVAKVYASNAIREKNQGLNYLKLASKLDSVAAKLKQAQAMQKITPQMAKVTRNLGAVMKNMDTVKMGVTMEKFETLLEDFDVTTGTMEASFDTVSASTTPADQVDDLMKQVADEHDLTLFEDSAAPATRLPAPQQNKVATAAAPSEEDSLAARLAALEAN